MTIVEIVFKASLLLALGLFVRSRISVQQATLRHSILLSALLGSVLIPIAIPLVRFRTSIPLPVELAPQPSRYPPVAPTSDGPKAMSLPMGASTMPSKVDLSPVFAGIWCLGFLAVGFRYRRGLASLKVLRRRSRFFASEALPLDFNRLTNRDNCELRISGEAELKTAMTWGVRRPVVLLPADAVHWTPQRLEMILIHEFAHLRRKDFASQMLVELVCALYWFNPLVWLSARALREDAELAADDAVIQVGIRPSDYATELLTIAASLSKKNPRLSHVGISNMTHSKIESRLKAILSSRLPAENRSQNRGITVVPALLTITLTGAAISGIASLKMQDPEQTPAAQKTLALSRAKQLATATLLYANDYDEVFPYATSTPDAKKVVSPYTRNMEVFKSPREGAEFRYNMNIGGVNMINVESPAEIPIWFEVAPKGIDPAIGYSDGHAKIAVGEEAMKKLDKALKVQMARKKTSKPIKVTKD